MFFITDAMTTILMWLDREKILVSFKCMQFAAFWNPVGNHKAQRCNDIIFGKKKRQKNHIATNKCI